ncbi:hypothetical protein FGM00_00865 [Aggregatimonas sangjinii]|uniref:Uncharacterized protein n=2 Tax=Aggregatimonas sangjinii TaxID=2583587 RepID=A0A5B7SZN5_9FLAO|nr:hypothetical protein FGM00_00865 [Aggregatimonas sangjinii]
MAFLLLASTVSWTVGKHYCMGRLMDVSLFEHAEDCGMAMDEVPEYATADTLESCCNDELVVIEGQEDLKMSSDRLTIDQQLFVSSFVFAYINRYEGLDENIVPFKDYSPPPLIRDVQILDQTFLI